MMIEAFDAEYELGVKITKGFRSIFEKDTRFVYNKNHKETGIIITVDYPEESTLELPEFVPHLVVSQITFQSNPQNSFSYNFMRDIEVNDIKNGAQQYAFMIPYSVTLLCVGDANTSRELSSRVNWYATFAGINFLSEKLGLQISNIQKGAMMPSKQFPKKVYDTPINMAGTYYWVGTKGPEDALYDIDKPLKNINIKF